MISTYTQNLDKHVMRQGCQGHPISIGTCLGTSDSVGQAQEPLNVISVHTCPLFLVRRLCCCRARVLASLSR